MISEEQNSDDDCDSGGGDALRLSRAQQMLNQQRSDPTSELHRLIGHQLKDRADVAEVVDDLLQILERWPLLTIRDEWSLRVF